MTKKTIHEISLIFLHETDKAILVTDGIQDDEGKVKKIWLPKSQIDHEVKLADMELNKAYTFLLPEWLVTEKNLDSMVS